MVTRRLILTAWLSLLGAPAAAQGVELFASGEQAWQLCQENNAWCVGFVTGALDGWAAMESYYSGEKFCLPEGLTTGEVTSLFIDKLDAREDRTETPGAYVLYEELIELYPCP